MTKGATRAIGGCRTPGWLGCLLDGYAGGIRRIRGTVGVLPSRLGNVNAEPLFSVILPTFNRPDLLAEAVESVLAQTVPDFELLVVDDGSDQSVSLPNDERIRLITLGRNNGPAVARNAALRIARGRYLTFLDDDDLFTADRLELALQGLAGAPIALCWGRFSDEPDRGGRVLEGDTAHSILAGPTPTLGYGAVRRELAVEFDERWLAVEDIVWWLRMSSVAPVTTVRRIGYLVRRHDGLRGRNHLQARFDENLIFHEEFDDYLARHPAAKAYRLKRMGLMALALDDLHTARSAFARSLLYGPQARTAWHLARSLVRRKADRPQRG